MRETNPMDGEVEPGETLAVELWNRTEPRSVINLVPGVVANALLEAGKARPDLFGLDERTLAKTLRDENKQPTATDNRLRLKFWDEYNRAQADNDRMQMTAVYSGVCTKAYFDTRYCGNPVKVAWLMCMPASYEVKMEEALAYGIEQLRDILELPNKNETTGRIDVKLMELKAKIVAMMDVRVKGGITQRVENTNRNMNLNISTSDKAVAHRALGNSMEEIEKRLKELDRRDRLAAPKDVKADVEDG